MEYHGDRELPSGKHEQTQSCLLFVLAGRTNLRDSAFTPLIGKLWSSAALSCAFVPACWLAACPGRHPMGAVPVAGDGVHGEPLPRAAQAAGVWREGAASSVLPGSGAEPRDIDAPGKTARLRIDKPLSGWSDSPSGQPLLGGRQCRCRELFNSGPAGVRLSVGGREIPR